LTRRVTASSIVSREERRAIRRASGAAGWFPGVAENGSPGSVSDAVDVNVYRSIANKNSGVGGRFQRLPAGRHPKRILAGPVLPSPGNRELIYVTGGKPTGPAAF